MSDNTPPSNDTRTSATEMTCDYVVESIDPQSRIAQVRFTNPHYSGSFVVEEKVLLPQDASSAIDGNEPKYTTTTVDKDPNPDMTKSVNVPFTEIGPNIEAFAEICAQQARGARNRMEAAYARNLASANSSVDLSSLVGMTNKGTAPSVS